MFGQSNKEKYDAYLLWFKLQSANPANWEWLRADKDCENYQRTDETPRPYSYNEACIRFMDPKVWAKAITKSNNRHAAMRADLNQYVGGNPANGKLNPEYIKNDQILQEAREKLKMYTGSPEAASDELFRIARTAELEGKSITEVLDRQNQFMDGKNPDQPPAPPPQPQGKWVELSAWQAFQHWLKGGKVEEVVEQPTKPWMKK